VHRAKASDDEATGFAGWLYADLLLGLAVVFLGAGVITLRSLETTDGVGRVTRKPLVTTSTSSTVATSTTLAGEKTKRFYNKALRVTFYTQESARLRTVVDEFIAAEGLRGEPEVALVLLFGSVGDGENPEVGAKRAEALWPRLIADLPSVFSDRALLRPLNNTYLARGQFAAEIYFQYFDEGRE